MESVAESPFRALLVAHRTDVTLLMSKPIPAPIKSFKQLSMSQEKLVLRLYQHALHGRLDAQQHQQLDHRDRARQNQACSMFPENSRTPI